MNNEKIVQTVVETADKRKANDIVVLKTEEISSVARYMIILDAPSNRQVKAISDSISDKLVEDDVEVLRIEGTDSANWILMDLGDVLINIFKTETREFYNLEKLWSDAPMVNINKWLTED